MGRSGLTAFFSSRRTDRGAVGLPGLPTPSRVREALQQVGVALEDDVQPRANFVTASNSVHDQPRSLAQEGVLRDVLSGGGTL